MGHQRLGWIPTTRKWKAVVDGLIGNGGLASTDIDQIAGLTLDAASPALVKGLDDPALTHSFYLLTQIALAAREPDWRERLARAGISLSDDASLFDLTTQFHAAVDRQVCLAGQSSDLGEMAQQAAGDALASLAGDKATTLFGSGGEHLQRAIRPLSTAAGFSKLGQAFFGRLLSRFLGFYVSRVVARAAGTARAPTVSDVSGFNEALQTHCHQSARIVRDFCGQWFSKREYLEGIDPKNTSGFMAVAVRKLVDELGQQRLKL